MSTEGDSRIGDAAAERDSRERHYESKYAEQYRIVQFYAVDGKCECIDSGTNEYAFWAHLANGYRVCVSNDEMSGTGGPESDITVFSTAVYRDDEFVTELVEGSLHTQLRNAQTAARNTAN